MSITVWKFLNLQALHHTAQRTRDEHLTQRGSSLWWLRRQLTLEICLEEVFSVGEWFGCETEYDVAAGGRSCGSRKWCYGVSKVVDWVAMNMRWEIWSLLWTISQCFPEPTVSEWERTSQVSIAMATAWAGCCSRQPPQQNPTLLHPLGCSAGSSSFVFWGNCKSMPTPIHNDQYIGFAVFYSYCSTFLIERKTNGRLCHFSGIGWTVKWRLMTQIKAEA